MISVPSVIRMYILESLTLYLSYGCLRMCLYTSWQHFANMMSLAKMAITARTASKFCAKTRSECSETFLISPISRWIYGAIEPWPECHLLDFPSYHQSCVTLWQFVFIIISHVSADHVLTHGRHEATFSSSSAMCAKCEWQFGQSFSILIRFVYVSFSIKG